MKNLPGWLPAVASLLLSGCIHESDSRSYYLHEDGKVDFVMLLDDVHSTDSGPKRSTEEKQWFDEFKHRSSAEFKQLKESHVQSLKTDVLRQSAPFAVTMRGTYPSVKDFGTFLDLAPTDPKSKAELVKDGKKRTLVLHAEREKPAFATKEAPPSDEERDAEHRIFWRFVTLGGTITSSKACIISQDKRSCLLDVAEITRQGRNSGGIDISVSWTLD